MNARDVFAGGVAVVTGAGGGLGEGLAHAAANLGMTVVLADLDGDRLARVTADVTAGGGTALAVSTDVADAAAVARLAAITHERFGHVRLLVNNAGIEMLGVTWEVDAPSWERTFAVNVLGVIHGVRAFVPRMLQAGEPAFIANLSSIGALSTMPIQAPYIVSKHAVLAFSECLATELRLYGDTVHVSVVLPGPVRTAIFEVAGGDDANPVIRAHRDAMVAMLRDQGMPPREAADRILDGVAARSFWVSPHPEVMAMMAAERGTRLAALGPPALPVGAETLPGLSPRR